MGLQPEDIVIYIYKEQEYNKGLRRKRLLACATHYAEGRGLAAPRQLAYGIGGKPFWADGPGLHFSISHSGGWWLAAFHGAELGLDIQQQRPCDYLPLARRRFHIQEYQAVQIYGATRFFDIWCAKESFCKQRGRGIDGDFANFCVVGPDNNLSPSCSGQQFRHLLLWRDYSLCVCAEAMGGIYAKFSGPDDFIKG